MRLLGKQNSSECHDTSRGYGKTVAPSFSSVGSGVRSMASGNTLKYFGVLNMTQNIKMR